MTKLNRGSHIKGCGTCDGTGSFAYHVTAHIEDRHNDIRGLAKKHYCYASLEKISEEKARIEFMHVVLVYYHRYQLITQHIGYDDPGYRYDDRI